MCVCVAVTGGMPVKMPQESSSRVSKESDCGGAPGSGDWEELWQRLGLCVFSRDWQMFASLQDGCTHSCSSTGWGQKLKNFFQTSVWIQTRDLKKGLWPLNKSVYHCFDHGCSYWFTTDLTIQSTFFKAKMAEMIKIQPLKWKKFLLFFVLNDIQ